MSEGFKDYVEQRAMTDHAQRFRGCTDHQCIYLEGKPRQGMGTNGGCRCDPRPLLRDMQQRIAQAHAAGRLEGMEEAANVCRTGGKPHDIDWWREETKREVSRITALDLADLIESKAKEASHE